MEDWLVNVDRCFAISRCLLIILLLYWFVALPVATYQCFVFFCAMSPLHYFVFILIGCIACYDPSMRYSFCLVDPLRSLFRYWLVALPVAAYQCFVICVQWVHCVSLILCWLVVLPVTTIHCVVVYVAMESSRFVVFMMMLWLNIDGFIDIFSNKKKNSTGSSHNPNEVIECPQCPHRIIPMPSLRAFIGTPLVSGNPNFAQCPTPLKESNPNFAQCPTPLKESNPNIAQWPTALKERDPNFAQCLTTLKERDPNFAQWPTSSKYVIQILLNGQPHRNM